MMKTVFGVLVGLGLAMQAGAGFATQYDQKKYCKGMKALSKNDQIALPVSEKKLTKVYKRAGLESRLESQMFLTMVSGEGELGEINEFLSEACGLTVIKD